MIGIKEHPPKTTFDRLAHEIKARQYAEIPIPISKEGFAAAAEAFFDFLSLPQREKDALYRPHPMIERDSGIGYVRKKHQPGISDGKEYVHYLPIAHEYFAEALGREKRVKTFFDSARVIHQKAVSTAERIMRTFDIEFPGIYDRFFPDDYTSPRTPLRFLKYDIQGKGKFLARGHYDKAGCTLALAESSPGLRIGKNDNDLKPVVRAKNGAIFMPGMGFANITDQRFSPAWHDVIQNEEDSLSSDAARWAIVMFLGARDVPYASYEATHGAYVG
jgi:isopenicillin N synthase-like dioxygenase